MARLLATSSRETGLFFSSFSPIICLKTPSGGWPTRPCVCLDSFAFLIYWGVNPVMDLRTVWISTRPCLCSRRSMYGIPMVNPLSRLKGIVSPPGVTTFHSPFVLVDIVYPSPSSIGMEIRLATPCSFSQTCKSPWEPFLVILVRYLIPMNVIVHKHKSNCKSTTRVSVNYVR